jgi:deoxyribose-phosphate aldolase
MGVKTKTHSLNLARQVGALTNMAWQNETPPLLTLATPVVILQFFLKRGAMQLKQKRKSKSRPNIRASRQSRRRPHAVVPSPLPAEVRDGRLLASYIDHTLLKPEATATDVARVCQEAREHHFATVCVCSSLVAVAARALKGSTVLPIAVVGFPHGNALTEGKVAETRAAVKAGAQEIDMVINIGALRAGDDRAVAKDISKVVKAAGRVPVKVIIESATLTHDEKVRACKIAVKAKAAFVKTSTGFGPGGATVEDVALMRELVGPHIGVKASGGVRTLEDAVRLIRAGANRIGTSNGIAIVTGSITTPPRSY